jgi:hypothetical protein
MEQNVFKLSLIIEGTTEKVSQFMMPIKSIYNKNILFLRTKMHFLSTLEKVQTINNLCNDNIFVLNFFCLPF